MRQLLHKLKIPVALLLVCFAVTASRSPQVTTYYISNSGSDANNGTSTGTPFATLAKLNSITLVPGDQVKLARGSKWIEAMPVNQSGSSVSPIIFGAYGAGAAPLVSGFASLTSWTNTGGNIWSSSLPSGSAASIVTRGSRALPMGRTPNTGWNTISSWTGASSPGASIALTGDLPSSPNFLGATAVVKVFEWMINSGPITAHSGSTLTYTNPNEFPPSGQSGWGYFVQNSLSTLNAQDEWFFDPSGGGSLKYYSVGSPSTMGVRAAVIPTLVNISGRNYVTIQDIDFEGAQTSIFSAGGTTGIVILNCGIRYSGGDGIDANFMNNFTCTGNRFYYCQSRAITAFLGVNQTIVANSIVQSGTVLGMGRSGNKANEGMYIHGSGTLVQYNVIDSTAYNGIDFGGNSVMIRRNLINHTNIYQTDGGGIYTSGDGSNDSARYVIGNVIMNAIGDRSGTPEPTNARAFSVYVDEYGGNVTIDSNTMLYANGGAMYGHKAHDIKFRWNKSYCYQDQLRWAQDFDGQYVRNNVVQYNTFYSPTSSDYSYNLFSEPDQVNQFFSTINNNILARPAGGSNAIRKQTHFGPSAFDTYYTVASWKSSYSSYDQNSTSAPSEFNSVTPLIIFNADQTAKSFTLDGTYKAINGTNYNSGSIILQPYSSEFLARTGNLTPAGTTVNYKGRIIISNGP